jgi:8-oxo-dGTP pyrophosphatase MutT (NUDIX family)
MPSTPIVLPASPVIRANAGAGMDDLCLEPPVLKLEKKSEPELRRSGKIYGIIIRAKSTGKYCFVLGKKANKWSFPKGHLEKDETAFECMKRELYEETGIVYNEHFKETESELKQNKISKARYYIIECDNEIAQSTPHDTGEIECCAWMSKEEIITQNVNVDIKKFFGIYKP